MQIYRSGYQDLILALETGEGLGVLDTGYLQDYFGVAGQLTLFHLASATAFAVPMSSLPAGFQGSYPFALLPNGSYEVRGRVRDTEGYYSILSSLVNPVGNEKIIPLSFDILPGYGRVIQQPRQGLRLYGAVGALRLFSPQPTGETRLGAHPPQPRTLRANPQAVGETRLGLLAPTAQRLSTQVKEVNLL